MGIKVESPNSYCPEIYSTKEENGRYDGQTHG